MMGNLRVDENLYPIESMKLVRGGVELYCHITGREYPAASGVVRIHAPDGSTVHDMARTRHPNVVSIPKIHKQDDFEFTYFMEITGLNLDRPGSSIVRDYRRKD